VEKLEEKRPPERFRRKLEKNFKIIFKVIEPNNAHWCVLFQNRNKFLDHVNATMNLTVAIKVGNLIFI
jgi:hypothetical protein